jgi:hypothetical protein
MQGECMPISHRFEVTIDDSGSICLKPRATVLKKHFNINLIKLNMQFNEKLPSLIVSISEFDRNLSSHSINKLITSFKKKDGDRLLDDDLFYRYFDATSGNYYYQFTTDVHVLSNETIHQFIDDFIQSIDDVLNIWSGAIAKFTSLLEEKGYEPPTIKKVYSSAQVEKSQHFFAKNLDEKTKEYRVENVDNALSC